MDKEIKEKLHIEKVVNTGRLYPMKEACEQTGLAYETLKFYCNIGLVPGVKRDARNRRVFNDKDISWIKSLTCLKNCDMSIEEMKEYLALCLKGQSTIPERKEMLMEYIDLKQDFYDEVLSGKIEYFSNLVGEE